MERSDWQRMQDEARTAQPVTADEKRTNAIVALLAEICSQLDRINDSIRKGGA